MTTIYIFYTDNTNEKIAGLKGWNLIGDGILWIKTVEDSELYIPLYNVKKFIIKDRSSTNSTVD